MGPPSCSAVVAGSAIKGLPTSRHELANLVKGTAVFRLQQINGGEVIIQLDGDALVREAKSATKTGILHEECPSPAGYVAELHPIRPGQPNCSHWVKFAECKFGQRCVFNHPELPGSIAQKLHAAQRAVAASSSNANKIASAARTKQEARQQPTAPAPAPQAAPAPPAPAAAAPPATAAPAAAAQAAGPASNTTASIAEAGSSASATVCPMLLLRGVCVMGPRCQYSHPTGGSRAATPEPLRSAAPVPSQQAAVAAAPAGPEHTVDNTAASAIAGPPPTPSTVEAAAAPAAPAAAGAAAAGGSSPSGPQQQQRQQQQEPLNWQQQQYHQQQQYDNFDEGHLTWQQQQEEQVQQQHQQQGRSQQTSTQQTSTQQTSTQHTSTQQRTQHGKPHLRHVAQQPHLYPITGTTPEGLPHRPGAPNCMFYMQSGSCKFGRACVYHHMDFPPQPIKYVIEGQAAGRWFANKPVPFARIIMHLHRLWDYTISPAAQLKIWLAQHLISAANPSCKMWEKSAAAAIAADDYVEGAEGDSSSSSAGGGGGEDAKRPLGRYSCDLCRAGVLLQAMWREQPGPEAAASPLPYNKKLAQVFSTDPYFQVTSAPDNATRCYVRLKVEKVIDTLNW